MTDIRLLFFYLVRRKTAGAPGFALVATISDLAITLCNMGTNGLRVYETGVANIFMHGVDAKRATVCMFGVPTEWELGLMIAKQIASVHYLDDAQVIHKIDLTAVLKTGVIPCAKRLENLGDIPAVSNDTLAEWRTWYQGKAVGDMEAKAQAKFDNFLFSLNTVAQQERSSDKLVAAPLPFFEGIPVSPKPCNSIDHRDAILMKLAFAIVGKSWSSTTGENNLRTEAMGGGNNIGAVLTDNHSRILAWSVNVASKANGMTCHAECALVRAWIQKHGAVRGECRLYTTLEPCYMCAGILSTYCKTWQVFFGQADATIKGSALRRGANGASQHHVNATSAARVEGLYRDEQWKPGKTLEFLRSDNSRKIFGELTSVPDTLNTRLQHVNKSISMPVRPASDNVHGRLGLDLPRQLPAVKTHEQRLRGNLDLATLSIASRPPAPSHQTRGGGVEQELELVKNCVSLLASLRERAIIV